MNIYIQTIIRTGIIALSALIACSCVNSIGEEEKENTSITPGDVPIKISAKTLHTQISTQKSVMKLLEYMSWYRLRL